MYLHVCVQRRLVLSAASRFRREPFCSSLYGNARRVFARCLYAVDTIPVTPPSPLQLLFVAATNTHT